MGMNPEPFSLIDSWYRSIGLPPLSLGGIQLISKAVAATPSTERPSGADGAVCVCVCVCMTE